MVSSISGFRFFNIGKICSVLGLDESTLWNLFGLDLDVVVRSRGVVWSLGGLREAVAEDGCADNVDWPALFGYTIGSRPREAKIETGIGL